MRILHQLQRTTLLCSFVLSACFLAFSQSALSLRCMPASKNELRKEPIASTTPTPSPSLSEMKPQKNVFRKLFHFLRCNRHKWIKEQELLKTGPQLPDSYNPSNFSFPALIKGGWPAVIVYELEIQSSVIITVEAKEVEPFVQELAGTGRQKEIIFRLPARFGEKPQAAVISIKAFPDNPRGKKPDLRLYALGIGDEAVGSVAIEVKHPGRINTAKGEKLTYDYRSEKFFNAVRADFWRGKISKGKRRSSIVDSIELGDLPDNVWKSSQWNGRRKSVGEFSIGPHHLNLNARINTAPWLLIWSDMIYVD